VSALALLSCTDRGALESIRPGPDAAVADAAVADAVGADAAVDCHGVDAVVDTLGLADALDAVPDADAAVDARSDSFEPRDAGPDATDGGEGSFDCGGGGQIEAPVTTLNVTPDCSGVPASLFSTRYACMHVTTTDALVGTAHVCFPDPLQSTESGVIACVSTQTSGPTVACSAPDRLFSGRCCRHLPGGLPGRSTICGDTGRFGDFAAGVLFDSDGDFVPDIDDNCIFVPNTDQLDAVGDGVGDACRGDAGRPE
jgi:hypothetical protein